MSSKYRVDKFRAENVAIGDYATVIRAADNLLARDAALREVERLISLIAEQEDQLPGADKVGAQARELKAAMSKKKLNRNRIERVLTAIIAGVSGIAALTNAVDALQGAVGRLFS